MGEEVEIILPKYDFIDLNKLRNIKLEVPDFKCIINGSPHANAVWTADFEECSLHLLEARHPAGFFHRGKIYGCEDDAARFLYFSKAALEYLKLKKQPIDVLHLHDWHVACCAPLVKDLFKNELSIKAILFTIHNLEYQGKCAVWDLDAIGLSGPHYLRKEKLQDNSHPKTINLMKAGIVYSDAINTVSSTYAKEILTPEMGWSLDPTLRKYKSKLSGILNGIDQKIWDPSTDSHLSAHYSKEIPVASILSAKKNNREALQKALQLAPEKRPWVGSITRLVPQKSPELIEEALRQTIQQGGTFLLLGSSPSPQTQEHFQKLKEEFAGHPQVMFHFDYNEALSHQLYAALDFLIAPSRFEPCGLVQLIAFRYGTIPIVHATGGFKDTVFDCENPTVPTPLRNGFTFPKADASSMNQALHRAIQLFRTDPTSFELLIRRVMQLDFSWRKPAQEYQKLYRQISKQSISAAADSLCTKQLD